MVVGGYSLHCYCEACNRFGEAEYNPQTFAEAVRIMQKKGWTFNRARDKCWCPEHKGRSTKK